MKQWNERIFSNDICNILKETIFAKDMFIKYNFPFEWYFRQTKKIYKEELFY